MNYHTLQKKYYSIDYHILKPVLSKPIFLRSSPDTMRTTQTLAKYDY